MNGNLETTTGNGALTAGAKDEEGTETGTTPEGEVGDDAGDELRGDRSNVRSGLDARSETRAARDTDGVSFVTSRASSCE